MKKIKWITLVLLAAHCYSNALSLAAPPAPEVSGLEAIEKATVFLQEKVKEAEGIYMREATLGYHDESDELKWKIVFARSNFGYYFILVDMKGKASDAPKPKIKEFKLKTPEPKTDESQPKKDGVPWGKPANWEDVEF